MNWLTTLGYIEYNTILLSSNSSYFSLHSYKGEKRVIKRVGFN